MKRTIVNTDRAPGAIGPYSQAIATDNLVFVSGQLPLDPDTGELLSDDIGTATRRAMDNLKAILEAAGSGMERILKTTLFIADMDDFPAINTAYAEYFSDAPPARACVQVARLPKDARVEVEAVALLNP